MISTVLLSVSTSNFYRCYLCIVFVQVCLVNFDIVAITLMLILGKQDVTINIGRVKMKSQVKKGIKKIFAPQFFAVCKYLNVAVAVSFSSILEIEQFQVEADLNLRKVDHLHVLIDSMNPGDSQNIIITMIMVILEITVTLTLMLTIRMTMMTILI